MAESEKDENQKQAFYKKALENLYKTAPLLSGESVKICYGRISDIEKILAEIAIQNGDNQAFFHHSVKIAEALMKKEEPYDQNHPHFLALLELAAREGKKPPKTGLIKKWRYWRNIRRAEKAKEKANK